MVLPIIEIESASIKIKVKVCGDASSGQGHLARPGGQIETKGVRTWHQSVAYYVTPHLVVFFLMV